MGQRRARWQEIERFSSNHSVFMASMIAWLGLQVHGVGAKDVERGFPTGLPRPERCQLLMFVEFTGCITEFVIKFVEM